MTKQIGLIGLGKMGGNLALNLKSKGWEVVAYNRTSSVTEEFATKGITPSNSIEDLVSKLQSPRIVWTMLTAGEPTTEAILGEKGLINYLNEGDIVIEGGNSYFKDDAKNAEKLAEKGINYIDVGVSGGPSGALNGACLMIGGKKETFLYLENLFKDLSSNNAYKFFEGYGAGHFVKMVHNGIEYGMMQAIAEGFNLMKESDYNLNLTEVADIYNKRSVVESRLIEWLKDGFEKYGEDLKEISGSVGQLGEGKWTVQTAKEMGVDLKIIEESVEFRNQSRNNPSYTGKILSMLRNMFGGHAAS